MTTYCNYLQIVDVSAVVETVNINEITCGIET
jgi:hypothetical protein